MKGVNASGLACETMLGTNSKLLIFAGPTLYCAKRFSAISHAGFEVLPPVRRGDLPKLILSYPPGLIIIVDGSFHQHLSVSHIEIRSAVEIGWEVWGLASMGAIRAYEMRDLGVHGYGRVYQCFCQNEDFRDDEVSLLHTPEPLYRPLTEPLVHIRFFLSELVDKGILTADQETKLLHLLMSLWYGDRTLLRVRTMLLEMLPDRAEPIDELLMNFDRFRVKVHDLVDFLRERPWMPDPETRINANQLAGNSFGPTN
jgi:hypothetical protein